MNKRKRSSQIIGMFQFTNEPPVLALYDSITYFTERLREEQSIRPRKRLQLAQYRFLGRRIKQWKNLATN